MFEYATFYNKRTYALITQDRVVSYDIDVLPYDKNKRSTFAIKGRKYYDGEMLVQLGEYLFLLDACIPSTTDDTTSVTVKPFYLIFDRSIPFTQRSTIIEQIRRDVNAHFKNCTDALFALSWLVPLGDDDSTLPYVKPAVDDNGYYNLYEYIQTVSDVVLLEYNVQPGGVIVEALRRRFLPSSDAAPEESTTLEFSPVYDATGRDRLLSASFATDLISKITHIDPDAGTTTDYYLLDDGTVTTNAAAPNRLEGRWIIYTAANVNEGLVAAQFARSRYSHSIQIATELADGTDVIAQQKLKPAYNAKCTVKLAVGVVVDTRVTSVVYKSSENKVATVTCGRALTKLNDIIQEVRNARN